MTALDILVAARDRISDMNNWTTGLLRAKSRLAKDGHKFCAIGATFYEGGAWCGSKLVTESLLDENPIGYVRSAAEQLQENMYGDCLVSAELANQAIDSLSGVFSNIEKYRGFRGKQVIKALSYLQAASRQLGFNGVVSLNDHDGRPTEETHNVVVKLFDRAIRNLKRRHIHGGR